MSAVLTVMLFFKGDAASDKKVRTSATVSLWKYCVGITASFGIHSPGPVFSGFPTSLLFWFAHCTNRWSTLPTDPELFTLTLCPCPWDPVTMLTECPTPQRSEHRPTLRAAVNSAAPCHRQARLHSRQTAHGQKKNLVFS